jgi:hypothetical protein
VKKPFLFRFAQACLSPGRAQTRAGYIYDEDSDLVRWTGAPDRPAAIDVPGEGGPPTKKADIEKGDDCKDRRMWL